MTKVGDFDWSELLAKEDLSTRPETEGETGSQFRQANEPDFIPLPSTFKPITPMPANASSPPINKQAWQSSELAKRRQMLMLATIAVAGSLLAIGGFVAFMRMVGTKDKPIVNVPTIEKKLPELKKPEGIEEVPLETQPTVSPAPKSDNIGPDNIGPESIGPDKTNRAAAVPPNVDATKNDAMENDALSKPSDVLTNPGTQPALAPAINPTTKSDEDLMASAFGLGSISQDLNDTPMGSLSLRDNDVAALDIENAEVSRDQLFHPVPSPIPSWDKNSKIAFSSLRAEGISLLRCIDMFGRMSGVGVAVDWQSFQVAGIDLSKKIDINVENKSIAEMMSQLVSDHGLVWTLDPAGVPVVSASKEAMESKLPTDWSIAGLFPTEAAKLGCEDLLRLWGYDDVCRLVDGRLQWTEQATPIEKANMTSSLCQLAKLRNQDAGNWTQVPDASLVFSPGQWNSSFPTFERQISRNIVAPEKRPIAEILMLAADKTNLNLVIDWQNVWGHGLTPTESANIVLGGRKFPQIAKRFLNDYALELMPIGENTVVLTTRDVRRNLLRVIALRLPKNYKVDDLKQSLRELAPVVDDVSKFRVIPIAGTEDLFFARICSPRVDQLNDPDLMLGLGWPDR